MLAGLEGGNPGDTGISGMLGTGGAGGNAMLGTILESRDFGRFGSVFRFPMRRPVGKVDTLVVAGVVLPAVCGLLPSTDGRGCSTGLGPNLTFGLYFS